MPWTTCTICSAPCPGDDLDDEACCFECFTANLAGAELRPPASLTRDGWRLRQEGAREATAVLRVVRSVEDGREGRCASAATAWAEGVSALPSADTVAGGEAGPVPRGELR